MLGFCPNKKFKSDKNQSQSDWDILVDKVGEKQALKYFMENNDQLPPIEFINTLESKQERFSKAYDKENTITTYNIKEEKYHTVLPNEPDHIVKNRVSDDVAKLDKQRNFSERTDKQKADDEVGRKSGDKVHNILNNIGIRFIQKINKQPQDDVNYNELGEPIYKLLEKYFNQVIEQFKPGTVFKIEQIIYNPKADKAGKIDLLAIEPDGTHSIIDWKLIDFYQKNTIPFYKAENFNVQLNSYKQILKEGYNVEKFRLIRVMPIEGVFGFVGGKKYLKNLVIAGKNYDANPNHLNPLPVIGLKNTDPELAGNDKINNLIQKLSDNLKKLTDLKGGTVHEKNIQIERIEHLSKTIQDLQIKQDIKLFLDNAKHELDYIVNKGITNLSDEELGYYKDYIKFYVQLQSMDLIDELNKEKYQDELDRLTGAASRIYADINGQITARIIEVANDNGQEDVFNAYPETGLLGRLFRSISQHNHPIIKTFYNMIMKQKDIVFKQLKEIEGEITNKEKNLKEWAKNHNLTGLDIFKPLLQYRNNKWTGNLVDKYSSEYYKAKEKAEQSLDFEWFKQNQIFDKEKYNKKLEESKKNWEKLIKLHPKSKTLKQRTEEYEQKHNVEKNNKAYLTSWYIKPKESWRSNEYKYIYQAGNEPLKEFYELFTRIIKEYEDLLPKNHKGNFIPNVSKALIEQIMTNGLFTVKGMKDNIIESLSIKDDVSMGMVDNEGNRIRKVPIYYTQALDSDIKSYDLGKSLLLFTQMALNHKYMSEIEDVSLLLEDAMNNHPVLLTDATGNPVKNKFTGKISELLNSKNDIGLFTDYLNYSIYGIKQNSKDKAFGEGETKISGLKTFSSLLQFYSAKALSLNLASSVANGIGGNANAFIEGSKGRLYNSKQYIKAMGLLTSRNKEAIMALEYFDILSDHTSFKKAQNLSASKTLQNMTIERFYDLQRIGDYSVESSTLLAMMQSHTIVNGKIQKIKDSDKEKSLLDLGKIDKDKFTIEGLTDEEFGKFRRKVKYLYTTMKGNNNGDDINQIKLSILGQVFMQFRNWIPRMADERLGELRYTGDLELYEEGRYRAVWSHLITNKFLPNITNMITSNGLFGLGKGLIGNEGLIKAAKLEYAKMLSKNDNLKITEAEYVDLYIQNIRSTMMEIQMALAILGLFALVKPGDDDDKKDPYRRTFLKLVGRSVQELTFWLNPDSTQSLLKTPIPILGLLQDIYELFKTSLAWGFGEVTQNDKLIKHNKPLKELGKQFPLLSGAIYVYDTATPEK